ncbi:MAG: 4-hydroxyphenylpyruvate dioxygenase [bacterium]|nr:4-hydroxyphenylpyruvate dioxygenase [bacterium]
MGVHNPLGVLDIDHIHFTVKDSKAIRDSFFTMGFAHSARCELSTHTNDLFTQGKVKLVVTENAPTHTFEGQYLHDHGDGVCTIAFLVKDAEHALHEAVHRGAVMLEPVSEKHINGARYRTSAIRGFGSVKNLFVERPLDGGPVFLPNYVHFQKPVPPQPIKHGIERIDHLTNNVPEGEMEIWVEFYKRIFGFEVVRDFDIKGIETGLYSKVVASPDKNVIIPINEPQKMTNKKGQIEEFLEMHKGHGVQHIAFRVGNILETIATLKDRGIVFLDPPPETYYEAIPKRVPNVKQPLDEIQRLHILVDGDEEGYLLQLFTKYMVGPLFYEFIQREKHDGFGEGNFQALFDSIEQDQRRRGVL